MDRKQRIVIGSVAVGIAFVLLLVGGVVTLNPFSATNVSAFGKVCEDETFYCDVIGCWRGCWLW
jgi:hypothetical protein